MNWREFMTFHRDQAQRRLNRELRTVARRILLTGEPKDADIMAVRACEARLATLDLITKAVEELEREEADNAA